MTGENNSVVKFTGRDLSNIIMTDSRKDKNRERRARLRDKIQKDDVLWEHVARSVTPLEGKGKRAPRTEAKKSGRKKHARAPGGLVAPVRPRTGKHIPEKESLPGSNELDRRSAEKLRRGEMKIDSTLDLHGMREAQAHAALERAVLSAWEEGRRCLLVITGKGTRGEGLLRRRVPEWLGSGVLKAAVLRVHAARPKHGGEGALYVLLRRRRGADGEY